MSAIGGIYNFDRLPVHFEMVSALEEGLASRGPDGGGHFVTGSIAFVYRALHTNKESRREIQPLVTSHGHILCWDGRLDNREELIHSLLSQLGSDETDAEIVMAAYLQWGIDFLPRIIGGYALSLWDPFLNSLILARDPIGSHDLYYYRTPKRIMWSTDLGLLLELSEVNLEVNEHYIAGYLTRLPEPWQTPFKNFAAVPPAHAVMLRKQSVQVQRFWGLNPDHEIRYKTDSEYEQHFRELFREAVKSCLRSDRTVWCDLSGGLDSSSVVCMADQLINNGEAQAPALETVSCLRDRSPSSNETKFIRYVEEKIGKAGHHLPESEFPVSFAPALNASIIPNPLDIFDSYHRKVNELMRFSGARVRLCGNGGDEILNSVPSPSAELSDPLVNGNFLQLLRGLRSWSRERKKPYLKVLWQDTLLPTLPRPLQVALRHGPVKRLPVWLDPQFLKRTNLRELMLGPNDPFGFYLPSSRSQCIGFLSAVRDTSAGYVRLLQDVDIRLPILHRPLVEFMQAIPKNQRIRPGETRSLQRRALRDLLPKEILRRKGKGNPAEAIFRALCHEFTNVHCLLSESYVARYGYVNQRALMAAFERSRFGDKRAAEFFRIISLELWLRSLEQRRPRSKRNVSAMGSPEARLAETCSMA